MKSQNPFSDVDSLTESVESVGRMITLGRFTILFVFMPFLMYVAYNEMGDTIENESVDALKFKWRVWVALVFDVVFLYRVEKFFSCWRKFYKDDEYTGVFLYYVVNSFGKVIAYLIFKLGFMNFPVELLFDPKMEIKYLIVYGDYLFTVFITCVFVGCIKDLTQSAFHTSERKVNGATEVKPNTPS